MTDIIVSVENLENILSEFKELLGYEFIETISKINKDRNLIPDELYTNDHPFRKYWIQFLKDIDYSKRMKQLRLNETSLYCLSLFRSLKNLSEISNYSRLADKIKYHDSFFSTIFEIHTASDFLDNFGDILITDESNSITRVADFICNVENRQVHVECKSLDDNDRKLNSILKTFSRLLNYDLL